MRSLADFITIMCRFRFSVHTGASRLTEFNARVGLSVIYLRRLGELLMRALSLAEALKIIEGTFAAAKEHNCHALAAIVLDEGGRVKAFQKQDRASLMRFEIAYGKAFRSEEHTSELQSLRHLVCRLL